MKIYKLSEIHNGKYLFCYLEYKNKNGEQILKIVVLDTCRSFECVDNFACNKDDFEKSVKFLKWVHKDD
jgi:hypothetical protein